jgi:polyisoprenoid-binding protein YceI
MKLFNSDGGFIYGILFLIVIFGSTPAQAQTYSTTVGYAKFDASTSISKYSGETNSLTGKLDLQKKEMAFYLPVDSIKTGIAARDRDMYKLLETSQYTDIVFRGTLVSDINFGDGKQKATAAGTLTIRDEVREITVEGTLQKTGEDIQLEASWTLLLSDYNIDRPSKFFAKVRDKHEIQVNALLKKEKL